MSDSRDLLSRVNALSESLEKSEELLEKGDEALQEVNKIKSSDPPGEVSRESTIEPSTYADIMNLDTMTEDFRFVRDTLKEVTENARRVQNTITLELLESDGEKRSGLVMSFSELSKAITDAQKLYVQSYKEMSNTLLNLDRIKKNSEGGETTNNLHIHTEEKISTSDIINRLKNDD